MDNANRIARGGGLPLVLGACNVHAAARMAVSVVVAAVVVGVLPAPASTLSPAVRLSADSTALIMGGTGIPKPDSYYIDTVKNQYIAPTHPGVVEYVPVKIADEGRPVTGLVRFLGLVFGSPSVWGLASSAWPDEPWWKLSGLFDLTFDQSVQAGVADLEMAMADHGNDHLVIYGYSQGAMVANMEKRKLAEQYPDATGAPDIDFVFSGDPNIPNGGLLARFPGLHIPIIGLSFNGPEPTDTPFDTYIITRQYDGLADFPLYPLNVIADLNAVLGGPYVHLNDLDVSLADTATAPTVSTDPTGKNTYYFFETEDLPLFGPLRSLRVPEPLIDVVEPFFRAVVELGYDRSIEPWEPTPARWIPRLEPATVAGDLLAGIREGIDNARAITKVKESEPAKPARRTATLRNMVRGALGLGERRHDRALRGNGHPNKQTAAHGAKKVTAGLSAADDSSRVVRLRQAATPRRDAVDRGRRSPH